MAGLLLQLVSDMMCDVRVRRRFAMTPYQLMDEYGLSPTARQALMTMDRGKIADYARTEILSWPCPPLDIGEDDPDCGGVMVAWPDPTPRVFHIAPASAPAGGLANVLVKGEGLTRDATLTLDNGTGKQIPGQNPRLKGTYRCGHLEATVDLAGALAGEYEIKVVINPTDPQYRKDLPVDPPSLRFTVT